MTETELTVLRLALAKLDGEFVGITTAEVRVAIRQVIAQAEAMTERMAEVDDKLTWLHGRVDLLANRLANMRGNVTLDDAAAKRLTYAVGQFSARLDRLEAPPRRKRKPKTEPVTLATASKPNGEAAT